MAKEIKDAQLEALKKVKDFVGEGGLVPFEHGYKCPTFKYEGYTYRCHMVSDKAAYCRKKYPDGYYRSANLLLSGLPTRILNKLYNELNKYLVYCQTEA